MTSNLLLQVITVLVGLIVPRLFISTYGSVINGLNASISQSLIYLGLVEAGIGLASIQALYGPLSGKKWDLVSGIVSAARRWYLLSGTLFSLLLCMMVVGYPFIVGNQVSKMLASLLVLVLGGGSAIEYFIHGKYRVLLVADQKAYIIALMQIIALLVSTAIKVTLLLTNHGVLLVQSVSTLVYVLRVVAVAVYVRKQYPNVNYHAVPDKHAIKKHKYVLIHQLAGLVVFNSSIIILTIFTNLKTVSIFSIYTMVFNSATLLISSFSGATEAGFGTLLACGENSTVRNSFRSYEYLFFMVLTWVYTMIFVLTLPFVKLYTAGIHDANYVDAVLPVLFTCVGVANTIRIPLQTMVNAAGHFGETIYRALLEAGINLGCSLLFVQFFGIYGVLIGTIISFGYRTTDLILYTNNKILFDSPMNTIRPLMRNFLLAAIVIIILKTFLSFSLNNWGEWIRSAFIAGVISTVVIIGGNALAKPLYMRNILFRLRISLIQK